MAPSWTQDKLQKLLELLREHHKDLFVKSPQQQRKLKKETFDIIAKELNVPATTLKYKYFNLNSAYNTEIKKIEAAKKKGFFYRPTLPWFSDFKDIMEKIKGPGAKDEQEQFKRFSAQEDSISEEEVELEEEEEDPLQENCNADSIVVTIKQEYIDGPLKGSRDIDFDEAIDSIEFVQEIPPAQSIQQPKPASRKPVKRRRERKQEAELLLTMPAERPEPTDEFQMFANHVAEQLRHMNENSARKMQSEIHIIFDEEGFPFDSPVLEDMT